MIDIYELVYQYIIDFTVAKYGYLPCNEIMFLVETLFLVFPDLLIFAAGVISSGVRRVFCWYFLSRGGRHVFLLISRTYFVLVFIRLILCCI